MLIGNETLDLQLSLIDSAQCFHWVHSGDSFGCVLNGAPVWLWREDDGIHAEVIEEKCPIDRTFLRRYLDLDRDYAAVAAEYAHIPQARRAIELFPGLRVLNQPTWEALISFILSANNNVGRIRGLVAALCERFGAAYDTEYGVLYGFPTPEKLASATEAELRGLRVGYRAPFLIEAVSRVCEGFPLEELSDMPYEDAHAALTALPGVGDKVADCVLLFGCGHASAFPVDVWVERLMRQWFGANAKSRAALCREAREKLGEHAGLMQQFLFHAARIGAIELDA